MDDQQPMPVDAVVTACIGSMLIGSSPVFVRVSDLGPFTTGFYRIFFALPVLFLWMQWEKTHRPDTKVTLNRKDHISLFLAGLFFALDIAFWNWSIDYTAIVNATLLNNTAAFFVPLTMWIFFSEKPSLRSLLSIGVCLFGCLLLAGESLRVGVGSLIGDVVALVSGYMVALYVITVKRIRHRLPPGVIMFWSGVFSAIGLFVFAAVSPETFWPLTIYDAISIFGQAVLVHSVGQGCLAIAMGRVPAAFSALILLLAPVTAAILGWLVYDEGLSSMKILGIFIIMVSIACMRGRRKRLPISG